MTRIRPLYASLLVWTLMGFPAAIALQGAPSLVQAEESLRPDVGKPLQAAGELLRKGKYREALAKIHDADAAPSKNAYESYMIERMRMSAASGAGDTQQAVRSSEAVLNSGRLSSNEKLMVIAGLVGTYYRAHDYANTGTWVNRYIKEGGTDPKITGLQSQLRFQNGDYAAAAKETYAQVAAEEKAGRAPSEEKLQLLANAYLHLKDDKGYLYALERLVAHYPKKEYWRDVIARVQRKPGFSERLALDLYRLKLSSDNMNGTSDYMEMSQLAMQEGFNVEGQKIIDKGYAVGALGASGDVSRQKRLRDLAVKRVADDAKTLAQTEADAKAAADGTELVNLGLNYITQGQNPKGLELVDAGLKKDNFKRADDAKLRAGIAYVMAGQKAKAMQTLKSVQGTDGTSDLAQLWMLQVH